MPNLVILGHCSGHRNFHPMSDREFENYLTLLSGLLRLDRGQRAAIAEELRSHLEDRLEELIERGVARDEAIKQALAEFGDAAGLAGQFTKISVHRKRRWLMRIATYSAAATVLFAAGLAIVWPARNAGPGPASAAAQNAAQALPGGEGAAGPLAAAPTSNRATPVSLDDKLNHRIDAEFDNTPLKDALSYIADQTGIQFYVQKMKLDEAGLSEDKPVSIRLREVRASTLLDLLLAELELTYFDKDDLIVVTTPEAAEATLQIRVYDCRDLLAMESPPGADKFLPFPAPRAGGLGGMGGTSGGRGGMFAIADPAAQPKGESAGGFGGGGLGGGEDQSPRPISVHEHRAEQLMDILITNVDPDTWDDVGGPGSISEYNGLIVVTQTVQTHTKIEHVLDMLRQAAGLPGPTLKVVR
jgi:hypothetical protein